MCTKISNVTIFVGVLCGLFYFSKIIPLFTTGRANYVVFAGSRPRFARSCAKKTKSALDKSIKSSDPADDSFTAAHFTFCSTPVSNKTKSGSQNSCLVDIKPSLEELDEFCKTLAIVRSSQSV